VLASSRDGGLRLIAAAACVAAGIPWSDRLHDAATAWMADGDVLPGFWCDDADPFSELVMALAGQGNPGAAVRLVAAGLACPVAGAVRARAVEGADSLTLAYRSPAQALAGPLAGAASDENAGLQAIKLLRTFADITTAADQLAAVADVRGRTAALTQHWPASSKHGDPRATSLLARDLRHRPVAVHAVANPLPRLPPPPLPFDADLLEAVRSSYAPAPSTRRPCWPCCAPGAPRPGPQSPRSSACRRGTRWARASRWHRPAAPSRPPRTRSASP